jgi:anaerobic selenocysteine-containing dehydrogenase
LYIGSNAAEAHPVSMLHLLHAKETGCKVIVVDPRYTRTAAKSDEYVRIRSGTDIAFLFGVLYHIFQNGWEDKQYLHDRVYGMDKVREEVLAKWTPDKVEEVCGVPEAQVHKVAEMMAMNRPSTLVWCMGQTQHTIGNAIVRASCIVQLALGNIGKSGGGANIFRGHDNVQGATDVGPNPDSLPGYYGLAAGAWKHYAAVWGVDYAQLADARAGDEARARQARPAGGGGPVSVGHGRDGQHARRRRHAAESEPQRLPAAGRDAVRDVGFVHGVQPLAAMAREGHRATVRVAAGPRHHAGLC